MYRRFFTSPPPKRWSRDATVFSYVLQHNKELIIIVTIDVVRRTHSLSWENEDIALRRRRVVGRS